MSDAHSDPSDIGDLTDFDDNPHSVMVDFCQILSIDCLVITESHLDETIPTNLLVIPGMHEPIRHDRPQNGRLGGGCLQTILTLMTFLLLLKLYFNN